MANQKYFMQESLDEQQPIIYNINVPHNSKDKKHNSKDNFIQIKVFKSTHIDANRRHMFTKLPLKSEYRHSVYIILQSIVGLYTQILKSKSTHWYT